MSVQVKINRRSLSKCPVLKLLCFIAPNAETVDIDATETSFWCSPIYLLTLSNIFTGGFLKLHDDGLRDEPVFHSVLFDINHMFVCVRAHTMLYSCSRVLNLSQMYVLLAIEPRVLPTPGKHT